MKKIFRRFSIIAAAISVSVSARAQQPQTFEELPMLTVNENVTTVITATEPIRFVDISTNVVAGDQPINNTIRLKPMTGEHKDGDILAIVTIITERYRTQYSLIYTSRKEEAVTDKVIHVGEQMNYNNPAVTMSTEDMYKYARRIWLSPTKYRNVSTKRNMLKMVLNNVYSVGDYFFIDFSVYNKTNIRFDVDELRLKLCDKKITKAANNQTIEITPALVLEKGNSFSKAYRNVVVLKKMTFPNDKVLTIELSEKQISGRTITMNVDYEDVLNADTFSSDLNVIE